LLLHATRKAIPTGENSKPWKDLDGSFWSPIFNNMFCNMFLGKKDKSEERYNHNGPENVQIRPL